MNKIVYPDGASLNNQDKFNRFGGWGWVDLTDPQNPIKSNGAKLGATQNEMESYGLYSYLKYLKDTNQSGVTINCYTDSKYVMFGVDKLPKGKILTTNVHIWSRVLAIVIELKLTIICHKVKSHSGDKWNDVADNLATSAAKALKHGHELLKKK